MSKSILRTPDLMSDYRQGIRDRDKQIYEMRIRLMAQPDAMASVVDAIILKAVGLSDKSRGVIFQAVRRHKELLKQQANVSPSVSGDIR